MHCLRCLREWWPFVGTKYTTYTAPTPPTAVPIYAKLACNCSRSCSLFPHPSIRPHSTPHGLEDVSKYPTLFAELIGVGWTIDELTKLAGANLLRVLNEAEAVRDKMQKENVKPIEDIFANRVENPHKCQSL